MFQKSGMPGRGGIRIKVKKMRKRHGVGARDGGQSARRGSAADSGGGFPHGGQIGHLSLLL
ncbi:hypothetical protein HMP0721_0164 [Pseudoramibacter alactolyticus ATCC 23263]|uniref:Uncharacterized protein n=1 Tax=Pseudoramibacter alactolyticus ATCC 23263 TaxID=887929 RepID=E6MDT1_9FIRM|nr:hypothetical protein HMP0721_0164 [Pseudoramibacter alactolyticus ATCC 23263]